jgi:hypothetical protein
MPCQDTTQCVLFPALFRKPLVAKFDQDLASSDGGAVLLGAADQRLGLTEALGACLLDHRQPGKVVHGLGEILRQRVFAIACGYPDGNDTARLSDDPIHKMLIDRDPATGEPLASQPTLSRFENAPSARELLRLGETLTEKVITRHRRRLRRKVRRLTVDLDVSKDPAHGFQQLTFFNGHYDTRCYLPLFGFLTFNDEPEQHLFTVLLRPGNAPDKRGVLPLLRRLLPRLRAAFPKARILVRLDGGFGAPEILDFLDAQTRLDYVVGFGKNDVLERQAFELICQAWALWRQGRPPFRAYGECRYAARTWPHQRRVIIKAEVVEHPGRDLKENIRFVVTNLPLSPRRVYAKVYCARGEIENRIKELKNDLAIDRTSCSRFHANQLRVLMTAASYVLMQELRFHTARRSQVGTLREHFLKVGVRIVVSVRRIVLHLPRSYPFADEWKRVALALGARPG